MNRRSALARIAAALAALVAAPKLLRARRVEPNVWDGVNGRVIKNQWEAHPNWKYGRPASKNPPETKRAPLATYYFPDVS